jgi:hypothetical protein
MRRVVRKFVTWGAILVGACAVPGPEPPRIPSYALDPPPSALGHGVDPWMQGAQDHVGVRLLARGEDAFALRAASAGIAQHTLDLQ